jgi:hypothetical protein
MNIGRQRGEVESECVRVWEGERGIQRGEVESECVKVWEGNRRRHRGRIYSVGGRDRET